MKPLCDNIFDVQRSELVEVLERLRTAFWNDQVSTVEKHPQTSVQITTPSQPSPLPVTPQNYKRTFSELDEDSTYQKSDSETKPSIARKRVRLNTPQGKFMRLAKEK
jgi:hypothetical protein